MLRQFSLGPCDGGGYVMRLSRKPYFVVVVFEHPRDPSVETETQRAVATCRQCNKGDQDHPADRKRVVTDDAKTNYHGNDASESQTQPGDNFERACSSCPAQVGRKA